MLKTTSTDNLMKNGKEIGKSGEDLACEYLVKERYRILYRNYRQPWGEIDIITTSKDKTLVFIEVKAMRKLGNAAKEGFQPEDNLTKAKLLKTQRMCTMFVAKHPELIDEERGWRIDLIALTLEEKSVIINHYKNI
ncbi:YraN family protein [Candidatus Parcubacteria bacterium]|nr:MAG: YraN family protein [Candidatus Parcubacteria bacterium]